MVDGDLAQAWAFKKLTERDISDLFECFKARGNVEMAMIERAWSMPRQGVASSFKFGLNYGFLWGMLCAHHFRFTEITSHKWQRKLECLTKGDKNVSKRRAQQLFPELKVTHATADALLIAEYGRRVSVADEQHTPGPWRTDSDLGHEQVLGPDGIIEADCSIFAMVKNGPTPERNRANARLIAAAPELLEALEQTRKALEYWQKYVSHKHALVVDTEILKVDDAIAKAKGED